MFPHPGLFNSQGIPRHLRLESQRFEAKDGFILLATRDFEANGKGFPRTPFPLTVGTDLQGSLTTISADLFPGNILVTRVGAKFDQPVGHDLSDFLTSLHMLRSPKNIPVINSIIHLMNSLAARGRSSREIGGSFETYFALSIQLPHSFQAIDAVLNVHKRDLAALLIGAPHPETLREEVISRVLEASEELNTKAVGELLLLNRQGFIHFIPTGQYRGPHLRRFERTRDLATLASFARGFLREGFDYANSSRAQALGIYKNLEHWITHPNLVLDVSKSQSLAWTALIDALQLGDRLAAWDDYLLRDDASS
ncbi:hypothetical protein AB4Y87_00440 [Paenarthrobacter sp. RAF54_2]|uniref:hypothetical protein n=1 Tax=Paenarthrobacter sp. RAF54_2 TaxID=3233061 RepID=UPI003F99F69A